MKNLAIARRYAKALLIIAKEDNQAEIYREELDGFSKLLTKQKILEGTLTNPLYDAESRRKVLKATLQKLNLSKVMRSFLMLLFDKGRIGFIHTINTHYQTLADELKGIARAELIAASPLSEESVEKIRKRLSNMTGKDVVLSLVQDPRLIGGVVTKIGDLVIDGSIRTQLINMKESLKRGEQL
ncbi:MAG: ATP synthase F1 subunit delta [Desulfobacteraceae bacterium]|nr:MAG: ATP synthase F1 subunit delta [Desulfobacteraceae bacterium]